jgi:hypothetical protein
LEVSGINAHYLVDSNGKVFYRVATWYNVRDGGTSDPPAALLGGIPGGTVSGCNWTKLWMMESSATGRMKAGGSPGMWPGRMVLEMLLTDI